MQYTSHGTMTSWTLPLGTWPVSSSFTNTWMLLLLFLCWSAASISIVIGNVHGQLESRAGEKTSIQKGEVTAKLYNPPTAALDSNVTFSALINDTRGLKKPSYTLVWWDDITKISITFNAGEFVNLTKVYSNVEPKLYNMSLTVFDGLNIVAKTQSSFNLTVKLNGKIKMNQSLAFHRQGEVVSARQPFSLHLNLTDVFSWGKPVGYWLINGTKFNTSEPLKIHSIFIGKEGKYIANAVIAVNVTVANKTLLKHGNISKKFEVMSPVSDIDLEGESVIPVHEKTVVNVTFRGSLPVSLCAVIHPYGQIVPSNRSCSYTIYKHMPAFPIRHMFNKTGVYQLNTILQNRVSNTTKQFYFHVYDPADHENPVYIVMPVLFCVIGALVIAVAVLLYIRYRKSESVETANFGFHGHKVPVRRFSWLKSLYTKVRVKVRSRMSRNVNDIECETPVRSRLNSLSSYGSMLDSDSGNYNHMNQENLRYATSRSPGKQEYSTHYR